MLGRFLSLVRLGSTEKTQTVDKDAIAVQAKIPEPTVSSDESETSLIQTEKDTHTVLIDTPASIKKTLEQEREHKRQKTIGRHRFKKAKDKAINFVVINRSEVPVDSDVIETDKGSWGVLIDTPDSLGSRLQHEEAYKEQRAKEFEKARKNKQKGKKTIKLGTLFVAEPEVAITEKNVKNGFVSIVVDTKTTVTMSRV